MQIYSLMYISLPVFAGQNLCSCHFPAASGITSDAAWLPMTPTDNLCKMTSFKRPWNKGNIPLNNHDHT